MTKLSVCVLAAVVGTASVSGAPSGAQSTLLQSAPLRFEEVASAPSPAYAASGLNFRFVVSASGFSWIAPGAAGRVRFAGASATAHPSPAERMTSHTNVFIGNDPKQWRLNVPNYRRVEVTDLYPGIDATYYGTGNTLEYDLLVHPGASVSAIALRFDGDQVEIDRDGNLTGSLMQKKPVAYQIAANGSRVPVEVRFHRSSNGLIGFTTAKYDRTLPLVIDPVLTLGGYFSGSRADIAKAIGHDASGFLYIGGTTFSGDIPIIADSYQNASPGGSDAFIAKLDPNAPADSQVVYSTYFGGSGADTLNDMVVSPAGIVYFTGSTASSNLPVLNASQSALAGGVDAFVAAIDVTSGGGLQFSTYLGGTGNDIGYGIARDASGRLFVTGGTHSSDFPSVGAYQGGNAGSNDVFVAGYNLATSGGLFYSTYFGGSGWDEGHGIAVDANGNLWVAGSTYSYDFPLIGNARQPLYGVSGDAFLLELDSSTVKYSTYIGSTGVDSAQRVAVDPSGKVVVVGYTSSADFVTTPNAMQPQFGGTLDAFLQVWTPASDGTNPVLQYSSFYGGSGADAANAVITDASGMVYVAGYTTSADLPVTQGTLQPAKGGAIGAFALKVNPTRSGGAGVDFSSYFAGAGNQNAYAVDVDSKGNMYVAGSTTSGIFDLFQGPAKPSAPGDTDAFVGAISPCFYSLPYASESFPTAGGRDTISVTASQDCRLTTSSPVDWITVSPATAPGSANVQITVAANTTGQQRQAKVQIGNVTFLVGQNP